MADCKIVALKIYYFLFFGGFACFLPYFPVYLRQLGLLSYQAGIISGTQPFLTFLIKPTLGAAADRFDKHKQILMLCLLLSYCLMFCTMFVPPVRGAEPHMSTDCLPCKSYCRNSSSPATRLQSSDLLYRRQDLCNCYILQINTNDSMAEQIHNSTALQLRCLSKSSCFVCPCNTTGHHDCESESSREGTDTNLGRTFWILFFLLVPGQAFMNSSISQADAHAMHLLGNKPSDYGKQRMWGAVGWGLVSVIAGFAMDYFSEGQDQDKTDYSVTFYMFASFAAVTMLTVACSFDKWHQARPEKMLQSLQKLLNKPDELLFLAIMFVIGSSFGVQINFLFWYLKDLGSSQLLLGLASMVQCIMEIPFTFFSGRLIHRIGHKHVFQLALICYSIRFVSYSMIPGPWWVLAIEPLQGITFGAMYSAAITYASMIAPPGMETTVQGIVGAVQFGVGTASGALIGGGIFHTFGAVVLFRVYSIICLVACILYWLIPQIIGHVKWDVSDEGEQYQDSEENGPDIGGHDVPTTGIIKSYECTWENANEPYYTETSV